VPVGEDQKQHLELARDIAMKFNTDMGVELFPLPEPVIEGPATRVMSLRDGSAKMSKSDPSDQSRINLTDDADTIAAKVKRAKSDADQLPSEAAGLAGRPEAANLVNLMAALSDRSVSQVLAEFGGKGFGAFKPALADVMVAKLAPITERFNALKDDDMAIEAICARGAGRGASRGGVHIVTAAVAMRPGRVSFMRQSVALAHPRAYHYR
jgi:tryptophanyl-tRNA synthetase